MFAQTDHIRRRASRQCAHHALAYTPPLLIPHVLNAQRTRFLQQLERWLVSVHNAFLDMVFAMATNVVHVVLDHFQLKETLAVSVQWDFFLLDQHVVRVLSVVLDCTVILLAVQRVRLLPLGTMHLVQEQLLYRYVQ